MRVHTTQVNPYAQLDALHSAQKAAAKREAAKTRKKLMEGASMLSAESDYGEDRVARASAREESQGQSGRQQAKDPGIRKSQTATAASNGADRSISEWA
jgi:hypothetical protein